jgi:hypothetical protein
VKLRLTFPKGLWLDLVVARLIGLNGGCVFDMLTKRCPGQQSEGVEGITVTVHCRAFTGTQRIARLAQVVINEVLGPSR